MKDETQRKFEDLLTEYAAAVTNFSVMLQQPYNETEYQVKSDSMNTWRRKILVEIGKEIKND